MKFTIQYATEILTLLFLVVTFLQSGYDKVIDWKGNVEFIKGHFVNSPLKNQVPLLLTIILVVEILAGAMMFVGIFHIITTGAKEIALLGVQLSGLCLVFLLIGQRLAKDYAGAMSLAVYFLIALFGMFILQ